ncbi:GNAT family N-acetyltransferase [Bizionia myxarmorum]|uniref:GNAT family N-acetyltransferase n=2 Tax=Bizionia myxarmorum TaxID=291186 RepID=A0A5D0R6Z1_9FLAO|nr:GNAT family N-acetyltransferase [Bizionia myxarmorum]
MEYHQDRFQDASVMVFKNKKLIAVFPSNQKDKIIFSHQGLTYGGLVYSSKLKFQTVLDCFKSLLLFYESEGYETLNLKQLPSIYSKVPNAELDFLMFLMDAQLSRRDILSVVKLSEKVAFSKDRKDGVKRAIKNQLVVKNDDYFDDFWNTILTPNLKEKHDALPVHSLEEIKFLHARFPKQIKQFNVYRNDKLVAGTTVFISDQVAHSQYISGNENNNQLGSLDFLHDYLLKTVFKDKPFFDFGISNENQGKNVNSGLQYWKEGFGARAITQDFYTLPIRNHLMLNGVML